MTSDAGRSQTALNAATDAVLERYGLFGNLYGKAIPLMRDQVEEILAVALAAAAAASGCVVVGCTYSAAEASAYCTLHGVKWGRGGSDHARYGEDGHKWRGDIEQSDECQVCGDDLSDHVSDDASSQTAS